MNGRLVLYRDQWGNCWTARTVRELRAKIGGGGCRVGKMYRDATDGRTLHVGYVVGRHWCTAFAPVERPA